MQALHDCQANIVNLNKLLFAGNYLQLTAYI